MKAKSNKGFWIGEVLLLAICCIGIWVMPMILAWFVVMLLLSAAWEELYFGHSTTDD